MTPATSEARLPQITRESTSRPISSVPNQCVGVGAWRIALQLVAIGSCGAIHGAKTASTMNITTTAKPSTAPRRRSNRRQARRHGPASAGGVVVV